MAYIFKGKLILSVIFALVTRQTYSPGRPKKLCFTTPSLTPMVCTARLGVVNKDLLVSQDNMAAVGEWLALESQITK